MGTWVKETDSAIYLMEGNYYLDKIEKRPRSNGEMEVSLAQMKQWLARPDAPGGMVIAVGIDAEEPQPPPTIAITRAPGSVNVGDLFTIEGTAPASDAGQSVSLYIDGTLQSSEPTVKSDGSWVVQSRLFSPGRRLFKIVINGKEATTTIQAIAPAITITKAPSTVSVGDLFLIEGTAPLSDVGQPVSLYIDGAFQSSEPRVKEDGSWVVQSRLFSAGQRQFKIVITGKEATTTIRVVTVSGLVPLFPASFKVPETQLNNPNYPRVSSPVLGNLVFTGGFMEPNGHSYKGFTTYAIFSANPSQVVSLPPSNRNLGIDYVVSDTQIRNWYPGRVVRVAFEGGYGNRCYVEYDVKFVYQGQSYTIVGAYAHAKSFSVAAGQRVKQGDAIGIMGGTGGNYAPHVDYRMWIDVSGRKIDLSPNVVEAQLD